MKKLVTPVTVNVVNATQYADCVIKLQQEHANAIDRANTTLRDSVIAFPTKLNELNRLVALRLPSVVKAKEYQRKLTDERIVSVATNNDSWGGKYNVYATVDELRLMRAEFGPFSVDEDSKEIYNSKLNLVKLPVEFEQPLTAIDVYLIKEIPAEAPCRIVKTTRTVEETSLVCDRPTNEVEIAADE